ncbi:MAG: hypothetical protein HY902_05135 [Deltaproteobacteria bacterium]|nr:hypothetical protein [Deltaproteobacteria bacterium]
MRTLDGGRRLTGPNFLLPCEGAAVEVVFDAGEMPSKAKAAWVRRAAAMIRALAWEERGFAVQWRLRRHRGGASWAFSAPIDQLLVATDIAEYAVDPRPWGGWRQARQRLRERSQQEANPKLLRLRDWARQHGVAFLWDSDVVSLGLGASCLCWAMADLPDPEELEPERFDRIPSAYVTGTNGKTTTARLLSKMARCAGLHVGTTTTDGWGIDGATIEGGDWTGPGAARKVLRDPRVELAVLEAARGGLLRRGLAHTMADVAIVTNASDDHLGEWGIDTVEDMLHAKLVVAQGVRPGGVLVANAGNPVSAQVLRDRSAVPAGVEVAWFGLAPFPDTLQQALDNQGEVAFERAGKLVWQRGSHMIQVLAVAEVPICFGGAALHNIENALCAILGARNLGLSWEAIRDGLRSFASTPKDNPGRANVFSLGGAKIVVDFAHNPDGVRHMVALAQTIPAARRLITLGQAGDRSDQAIADLIDAAVALRADHYVLKESLHYLRGRELGDVTAHMRERLLQRGVLENQISVAMDETAALDHALAWLRPGDLLVLLIHDDFAAAAQRLQAAGALAV